MLALWALGTGASAAADARWSPSFPIEYAPPERAAYQRWHEVLRRRHVLERLSKALAFVRLPIPLTLRTAECGESNAMYDQEQHSATLCYELVDELVRESAGAEQHGFTREDAVVGPLVFLYLHELAHALFDVLDVPVLGREEDAADEVATLILLRADPEGAPRAIAATAWMYARNATTQPAADSDLADVHPLDAQRFYNVLCLAYGSDPEAWAAQAREHRLSQDRADGCEDEYRQAARAFSRLLAPHLDRKAFRRTAAATKPRRAGATEAGR